MDQPEREVVERWVESEPTLFFDQTLERFFWPLGDRAELARWTHSQTLHPVEGDELGGIVTSEGGLTRLHRQVVLDADEIDRIVVRLQRENAGTSLERFSFFWAPTEEPFTGSRRIMAREGLDWEDDILTLELRVGDHPEWKERVVRIGLALLLPAGQRLRVVQVAGYSEDLRAHRLPVSVVDRTSFEYHLKEPEERNRWGRVVKEMPGSDTRSVMLRRPFHRQADEADFIEVVLKGLAPASRPHVVLAWSGADEVAGAPRILRQREGVKLGRHRRSYRFDLRDHPHWHGKLNRIRVSLFEQSNENITLESLTGLATEIDGGSLERALGSGGKVQLGHEVRNALPALPGVPVERQVVVPSGGSFRFSYGTLGRVPLPVTFRATVVRDDRPPAVLFTTTLTREEQQNRWHEAVIDLGRFKGREISVVLETESPQSPDPTVGLPYWGNPELLADRRGDAPPNVILISVDTLRADRLSLYGHDRPTSPNLDRWAKTSAVVFENAVAQAPWTLPSHLSMLSGLNAYRFPGSDARARSGRPMLARRLREAGYATLAVTGGGYLHPAFGFTDGFDRFRFFPGRDEHEVGELRTGIDQTLEWIDEHRERPFFLFLHTYEVHEPFRARQPWFSEFSDLPPPAEPVNMSVPRRNVGGGYQKSKPLEPGAGDESPELISDLYDSGIAYADEQLARLFDFLAAEGLDRRTLVVLTSDHGELLGEHGLGGHLYLWDENLMVPLVIARRRAKTPGPE